MHKLRIVIVFVTFSGMSISGGKEANSFCLFVFFFFSSGVPDGKLICLSAENTGRHNFVVGEYGPRINKILAQTGSRDHVD